MFNLRKCAFGTGNGEYYTEPFLTMDFMPFNLSSVTVPRYNDGFPFLYILAYDNSVRNSPPASNAVYGRGVM